jgi:hypothetical protein
LLYILEILLREVSTIRAYGELSAPKVRSIAGGTRALSDGEVSFLERRDERHIERQCIRVEGSDKQHWNNGNGFGRKCRTQGRIDVLDPMRSPHSANRKKLFRRLIEEPTPTFVAFHSTLPPHFNDRALPL